MFHDHRDNDPYACNEPDSCACEAPCWIASLCFSEFTGSKIQRVLLIVLEELVIVVLVVVVVVVVVVEVVVVVVVVVLVIIVVVVVVVVVELVVVVIVLALVILVVEDRISPCCDRHGDRPCFFVIISPGHSWRADSWQSQLFEPAHRSGSLP